MTKSERDKLRLSLRTPEQKAAARSRRRKQAKAHVETTTHMADGNPWKKLTSVLRMFAINTQWDAEMLESNNFDLPDDNTYMN